MVSIAFTIISLVVLSVAIFTKDKSFQMPNSETTIQEEVLSQSTQVPEQTEAPFETATAEATPSLPPSQTPVATKVPDPAATVSSNFKYPKSDVVSENNGVLVLTTTDNEKVVFDWYKAQITSLGYHSTSMIRASTVSNGQGPVEDKIVAVSAGHEVKISIKQTLPDIHLQITVEETVS